MSTETPTVPNTGLLRPSQRRMIQNDIDVAERVLKAGEAKDPSRVRKSLFDAQTQLDTQAPKPYEPADRDRAAARAKQLETEILHGMPTQEHQRKNRDGAVDTHIAWETLNKTKILEWREIQLRLNHDADSDSVANFETKRPSQPLGLRTDAQIGGVHAMSEQAKQNYPEDLGKMIDSAVQQALRAYKEEQARATVSVSSPTNERSASADLALQLDPLVKPKHKNKS